MKKTQSRTLRGSPVSPRRCGLCGSSRKPLIRTDCCGNWICNDADEYVLFSYARNSCIRNHDRFTLCSSHFHERHKARWQDCKKCFENFVTEMYVWYGTNEYNFETLENPPTFEPTHCADCRRIIHLGTDGYTIHPSGRYYCETCAAKERRRTMTLERKGRNKSESRPRGKA
jgi:hypothetical protein